MKTIMWIARDANGLLYLYNQKPRKRGYVWNVSNCYSIEIMNTLFPEVKWKDPEPKKVEIKIIK